MADRTALAHARHALCRGADPFADLTVAPRERVDIQGWNSRHRYLSEVIERTRPRFVLEMGVWKGASALWMASLLRDHGIDGVVIAVDTWLGSWEHWTDAMVSFDRGYPRLFAEFADNVLATQLDGHVVPLPLDSGNAAKLVLLEIGQVDVIHLDGAHDYEAVAFDLRKWWPVLRSGGTFIGDDYYDDGPWPDVKRATDDFLARTPHDAFEFENGKWRAVKP